MDNMIYISMTGAKNVMYAQSTNSNNLANVNTYGFKADLDFFQSQPVYGPGNPQELTPKTPGQVLTMKPVHSYQPDTTWMSASSAKAGLAFKLPTAQKPIPVGETFALTLMGY